MNNRDHYITQLIEMKPQLLMYFTINTHRDFAEDLYHDLVIKVLVSFDKGRYREEGKFKKWVAWVAKHVMVDYHRYYKRRRTVDIIKDDGDGITFNSIADWLLPADNIYADSALLREETVSIIRKGINQLQNGQKEIMEMKMDEEMSFKEIAERTGESINTGLGRMRYGVKNLRKYYDLHS